MDEVFREYSEFYDILYGDKNYSAECDFLEEIFLRFSKKPIKKILDIGCGTGGHALHLAQRRYDVTGIDRSEEMLKIAQEKASRENLSIKFKQADVRTFSLNDKFDAVIAMFAVMGYQKTNEDIEAAVRSVRKHLEPGNLFIFDVWFGPAVISEKPSERVKFLEQGGEKIIRIAQPQLDLLGQTVQVNYTIIRVKGKALLDSFEESHVMRFLFPQELNYFLKINNFTMLKILPFMSFAATPTIKDWNIAVIAKALAN